MKAFLASALGTGVSRVLGAGRDIALANFLGAGAEADAFRIAFTIPNTFRRFVADEGLTGALVPAIARAEAEDGTAAARSLADRVFTALMALCVALCLAGMVWADALVAVFATGWRDDPEQFALAVRLTRWLMPFLAMVSAVSFFEGLLNHRGHFLVPKIAPGVVSAGIIAGIVWLGGAADPPVMAVVWGVLGGGVVHLGINLPPLWSRWGALRPGFRWRGPRFSAMFGELGKVAVIGVFSQLNIIVLRQLATALPQGAVTHYDTANRLVDLAQGVIAVAIGSALLPAVSQAVAAADWERFRAEMVRALRLLAFLLFPATAVILGFATPITAVMFRHGQFTWADVQATAATLLLFTPFMLGVAGIQVLKKAYFALDDRTTLLVVGAVGVALTGALGWALTEVWGVAGLSAALSLSTVLQLALYAALLRRRLGENLGFGRLPGPLLRMALAAAPVTVALHLLARLGEWERGPASAVNLALLGGGLVLAAALYALAARALHLDELRALTRRLRRR